MSGAQWPFPEKHQCSCIPRCEPKTEVIEGIEFWVPVWCKTPQAWNNLGGWLDDQWGIKDRVETALKDVSDLDALEQLLDGPEPVLGGCPTYWGSHGCSLDEGHAGKWHICDFDEVCMAVEELGPNHLIAWDIDGERDTWKPWGMSWGRY